MNTRTIIVRGAGWHYEMDWGPAVSANNARTLMEAVLTEFQADERVPDSVIWFPHTSEVVGNNGQFYDLDAIEQAKNIAFENVTAKAIEGKIPLESIEA